jgi:hydrogenase maturation protease
MGAVLISAEKVAGTRAESDLYRLRVLIENTTPESNGLAGNHEAALLQSFISTHTIIQAHQAEFISLLEPPETLQEAAQGCRNLNTWPVLLGNKGDFDAILSSPIILYDYPQIAPESAGPLFDGTEIDEILTLRILTLTDAEKEELRRGDRLGRELLERIEALSHEQLMKLHGVIRNLG